MNASIRSDARRSAGLDHLGGLGGGRAPSGFSHSTCLPAAAARSVHSAWRWLGNGMYTASTSGSASRSSYEPWRRGDSELRRRPPRPGRRRARRSRPPRTAPTAASPGSPCARRSPPGPSTPQRTCSDCSSSRPPVLSRQRPVARRARRASASPLRTRRHRRRGSPLPPRCAAAPRLRRRRVRCGSSAASRATRIIALTCDSSEFWAASTTASWKSSSAARKAIGSADGRLDPPLVGFDLRQLLVGPSLGGEPSGGGLDRRADLVAARAGPRRAPCRRTARRRRRRRAGATPDVAGPGYRSSAGPRRDPWPAAP